MARAENDLHRGEELVGRVSVGALVSFLRTSLADVLAAFQRRHPRVELRVGDGETIDQLEQLAGGRLDVVLAESWSTAPLRPPRRCDRSDVDPRDRLDRAAGTAPAA